MTARTPHPVTPAGPSRDGATAVTALWVLLLLEAALGLVVTILLSIVAGDRGEAGEESTRFAAGGAFLFAIAAFIASRGARRRRGWAWTLAAILQLLLAIGAGIALFAAGAEGAGAIYLVAFALAAATMLLLSVSQVRRALGQA